MGNVQEVFENIEIQPLDVQLLYAAEYGDVEYLQQLLDRHKDVENFCIDVTTNYLWTPLFMAAKQGHADCVKLLLEAGTKLFTAQLSNRNTHFSLVQFSSVQFI